MVRGLGQGLAGLAGGAEGASLDGASWPWSRILSKKEENALPVFDRPKARSLISYYWESRQAEPLKGVTPMVHITMKMDALTFILVVLIVLKAMISANK